jgi:hypothetical protein
MSDVTGCIVIPGPRGASGTAGTNGIDGADCLTLTTAPFTMPDGTGVLNTVDVAVLHSSFMVGRQGAVQGLVVYVEYAGYMEVYNVIDGTNVTLLNPDDGTHYLNNAPTGTVVPTGAKVVAAGVQGP